MAESFKQNFLSEVHRLFSSVGVGQLSEEKIIEALDISPAVFYGMFRNFDDLVVQAHAHSLERYKRERDELYAQLSNPVEQLVALHLQGFNEMTKVTSTAHADMVRLYPQAAQLTQEYFTDYAAPQVLTILREGVAQHQFRADIDCEIVTRIIMAEIETILNPLFFPVERYKLADVFRNFYFYYIRGLCTAEGLHAAASHFERIAQLR